MKSVAKRLIQTIQGKPIMPSWSDKDKRQFDHIRDVEVERGKSTKKAAEVAARTVNKQRRSEGRTPNKTTQGTGNPHKSLTLRTVPELRNLARKLKIAGRSRMNKSQLIEAIRQA
jgi:plasmid stabilization system protein ParE